MCVSALHAYTSMHHMYARVQKEASNGAGNQTSIFFFESSSQLPSPPPIPLYFSVHT